ncbi:MAG TPA: UDP-N-acetylmuramoyl-L-alanine--D-glutamate ligase [Candidatus Eisenbacteria bacterium]|nr:UDP-N-acetylmuramoyl-L-alanine--D-glutamate ligase [Candidatus Eisenbacteria bacterium]
MVERVLVVGYGRTGQAVARVLAGRGLRVRAADARDAAALGAGAPPPGVELRTGTDGPELLDGVDLVVPSPGVPSRAPVLAEAARRRIPVRSEIEVAARALACPIVGITGTNGKSTTTTLVGLALGNAGRRTFTGGNLGTPLITALEAPGGGAYDVCVAEVSSFQLEWVETFRPRVGCLLNVTDDHLDRHPTFAAYRDTKARLFAAQTPDDWAVLNRDDPAVIEIAPRLRARVVTFGTTPHPWGASIEGGAVVLRLEGAPAERYDLSRTRLAGRHNVDNILAAVATARLAGASPAAVQQAIDGMTPLAHRLTLVAERRGVRWYDDSKATNVGAAVRSLESFDGHVVLLAGGVDKGGSYAPLATAARGRVRRAFVFGTAREQIAAALATAGVPVDAVPTLAAAVAASSACAEPGDTVLLAPACSSFDQFTDYAERGRAFAAAVEALG